VVAGAYGVIDNTRPATQHGVNEPHRVQIITHPASGEVDYDLPTSAMLPDTRGQRLPLTMQLGNAAVVATFGFYGNELTFQSNTEGVSFVQAVKHENESAAH
jgi:hypothetical protein